MATGLNSVRYVIEAVDKVTSVYRNVIKTTGEVAKKHEAVNTAVRKSQAMITSLGNGMRTVLSGMSSFAGAVRDKIVSVGSTLAGLGKSLLSSFSFGEAMHVFTMLTDEASKLNGTVSMTKDIFGKSFDVVDNMSRQAADSMGMSRQAALKSANGFGELFRSLGYGKEKVSELSVASVRLVNDLASARGMTQEDAMNAYTAAIDGNADAAMRLGVSLDDTKIRQRALQMGLIKSAKDAIPDYVRSQAAMAEVIEQTTSVQGHFIRNMDSDRNATLRLTAAQDDLKAKLGEGLLPIKIKLLEVMNDTVTWANNNIEKVKSWSMVALGLGGVLVGMYVAATMISGVASIYTAISGAMSLLRGSTMLATIETTAFNLVASISPFGWIGIVIGAIVLLSDHFAGLRDKLMTFFEPVKRVFLSAFEWIYDHVIKPMFGWMENIFKIKIPKPSAVKATESPLTADTYASSTLASGGRKASKDIGVKRRNDALVSGQGKEVKNISIRIDKLVESLNINTTSLGMSTSQLKGEIERVLLSAVNEVNYQ
ncbi:MAG TPA: hypothetical protein PK047_06830 [Saprospiraceae bacterium]|jgi:hypothetical protein|nr:hypothetical protein [Saprospiraceae bacterium]HRP41951.1 hypothetical protein [Saprospiraceae bacterium]